MAYSNSRPLQTFSSQPKTTISLHFFHDQPDTINNLRCSTARYLVLNEPCKMWALRGMDKWLIRQLRFKVIGLPSERDTSKLTRQLAHFETTLVCSFSQPSLSQPRLTIYPQDFVPCKYVSALWATCPQANNPQSQKTMEVKYLTLKLSKVVEWPNSASCPPLYVVNSPHSDIISHSFWTVHSKRAADWVSQAPIWSCMGGPG